MFKSMIDQMKLPSKQGKALALKKWKSKSNSKTLEALFEYCGGEFEVMEAFLASTPFKFGEVKKAIGEDGLTSELAQDVKTGKVKKDLKRKPIE